MKKFDFSLDKVLDYKNQVTDSRQGEYVEAKKAVDQKEREIEQLKDQYSLCSAELIEKQCEGTDVRTIFSYNNYLSILGHQIQEAERILAVLQRECEIKRQRLLEAKKESMTIVRLKEHKYDEYSREARKESEKEMEEFVMNARSRSAGAG